MEQHKPEKPFMLQQLIMQGLLAGALLLCGWLFPAKYKALHPRVLEHAGMKEAAKQGLSGSITAGAESSKKESTPNALKQFIANEYPPSGDNSIQRLLKLGDEQLQQKKDTTPTFQKHSSALSIFVNPTNRLHKSPCLPAAKILPLRGADCSALRRMISFMGGRRAEKG